MCYKRFDEKKPFLEAEKHCIRQGGHLARISSEIENEFVGQIGGREKFWIGFWTGNESKCSTDKNKYVWTDGSLNTGFNHWRGSGPDCYGSQYGRAAFFNWNGTNNLWGDGQISWPIPFVCGKSREQLGI